MKRIMQRHRQTAHETLTDAGLDHGVVYTVLDDVAGMIANGTEPAAIKRLVELSMQQQRVFADRDRQTEELRRQIEGG